MLADRERGPLALVTPPSTMWTNGQKQLALAGYGTIVLPFLALILLFSFTDAPWQPHSVLGWPCFRGWASALPVQLAKHVEILLCGRHFMIQARLFRAVACVSQATAKSSAQSSSCRYWLLAATDGRDIYRSPEEISLKRTEMPHESLSVSHRCFPSVTVQINVV